MITGHFSEKVKKMQEQLEPYFAPGGGLKEDVPPEIKKLFEEFKKQVEKEAWFQLD